jgi:RNA polymerase sigma-70 factor (ECF subfamily)
MRVSAAPLARAREDGKLGADKELARFLESVERRAFRIARYALSSDEDALDVVQDAMIRLVRAYKGKPSDQWTPLFYRILNNRIRDWQRRQTVRNRVMAWLPWRPTSEDEQDRLAEYPDPAAMDPERASGVDQAMQALKVALAALPGRQREAFLLRTLEGLDVAETAQAMGCSAGSVKTHYSRAVHSLRETLGEHWK